MLMVLNVGRVIIKLWRILFFLIFFEKVVKEKIGFNLKSWIMWIIWFEKFVFFFFRKFWSWDCDLNKYFLN